MEYTYKTAEYRTPSYLLTGVTGALESCREAGATTLLEIGCGNGSVAAHLAESGWKVTATDASAQGIDVAMRSFASNGVRYEHASVYDEDWRSRFGVHDVVLAIEVIEHIQYPRELLRRSFEVLSPNGHLVLTTPYHGFLKNLALSLTNRWDQHFEVGWDAGHVRFFSPPTLMQLAKECGFTDAEWRGLGRVPLLWKSFLLVARRP
jgi:cyclopropane fatty-acyl-phospholipid synthase-like methyltransferase